MNFLTTKLKRMMKTVTIVNKIIIFPPLFHLKIICKRVKIRVIIKGISPGYIKMLSKKFPLSNSTNARCIPQPGHS